MVVATPARAAGLGWAGLAGWLLLLDHLGRPGPGRLPPSGLVDFWRLWPIPLQNQTGNRREQNQPNEEPSLVGGHELEMQERTVGVESDTGNDGEGSPPC